MAKRKTRKIAKRSTRRGAVRKTARRAYVPKRRAKSRARSNPRGLMSTPAIAPPATGTRVSKLTSNPFAVASRHATRASGLTAIK